jgi:hypothetical protein
MAWTFGLCELDGTALGEIPWAFDRRLTLSLNGLPVASVRLRLDDPLVDQVVDLNGDVLLKVYQDSTLRFIGDLTTLEEVSRAEENKPPSVVMNFAGPLWRLQKRLAGKAAELSPVDERGQIGWTLIDTTNDERDTGIRQGTIGTTAVATAGPWRYKPVAEALTEMAAAEVYPFEPTTLARDDFGFDGQLVGRVAPLGGTWAGVGDADDFVGTGTVSDLAVGRSNVSDTAPRIDYLSTDYGSIMVEAALRTTDAAAGSALGVVARFQDASNYVLCYLFPSGGSVKIEKMVAGVQTLIEATAPGTVLAGSFYTLRLWIDTGGNYKVWFVPTGTADIGAAVLDGTDVDLDEATGPLDTGRVGLYDHNPTATAHSRTYDAFVATPGHQRRDDFGFSGNLNTRTLPTSQTWGGAGSGGDFGGQGTTTELGIERTNPGDSDVNSGRYAPVSGSVSGAVYVQTAAMIDIGPYVGKLGVLARYTDTNNWVMATIDPGNTDSLTYSHISIRKRVGGTVTVLATSGPVPIDASLYNIRLAIDASGNYAVFFWPNGVSDPAAPILTGTDAQLAVGSGASVESGQVGLYDANTSALSVTRTFDAFLSDSFTGTLAWQTLNFELVPTEPTTDSEGVQIATYNASSTIGTAKDVVFEYGGNKAIRSYRRVLSREGLLNQGISLPETFPTSTDVRVKSDGASIAARGLFEEVVPSDVGDASLREALAAAHVAIRKDARQIITFEPSSNAPVFGTDYIVGDTVTGRATALGTVRFNGTFRVYAVEISIDETGKETIQPTLVPSE